jgi:hypothetical protein
MQVSNYFKSVAIAAAAIGAASSANAATITYTDSNRGPVYLQRFNPLLGTLQSVTFNNRTSIALIYNYTGDPSAPAPLVRIMGTIGEANVGRITIDEVIQSSFNSPRYISVNVTRTIASTFTTDLNSYIGTGSFVLGFFNLTAPGYTPASVSYGGSFNNVSVTYTYLASVGGVPEPATWAMMLTGLGMVAGATRYRRRKTAIALG